MNKLENMKKNIEHQDRDKLKYGISPLHARIKFFECLLRLSYRYADINIIILFLH